MFGPGAERQRKRGLAPRGLKTRGALLSSGPGPLFRAHFLTRPAHAVLVSPQAEGVGSARPATDLQWLSLCREIGRPMPSPVLPLNVGIAGGGGFNRKVRSPTC